MIPPIGQIHSGNSISVHVSVDKLMLGSIPDIGFPGDIGPARTAPLHLEPAHRLLEVHPVASAGTSGRPRTELTAGAGDAGPARPGPNRCRARAGPPPSPACTRTTAVIGAIADVVVRAGAGGSSAAGLAVGGRIGAHPGGGDRLPADRRVAGHTVRVVLPGHRATCRNPVACCPIRMSRCAACRIGRVESLQITDSGRQCRRQHHVRR